MWISKVSWPILAAGVDELSKFFFSKPGWVLALQAAISAAILFLSRAISSIEGKSTVSSSLIPAISVLMCAHHVNDSVAAVQALVSQLGIFRICVKWRSSVTLESCGSLVQVPGCFEGASLHWEQKEPCQCLCSDLDTFVQCLESDGKNWGQIRFSSCSLRSFSKIF